MLLKCNKKKGVRRREDRKYEGKYKKIAQTGNLEGDEKKLCTISVPDTDRGVYWRFLLCTNVWSTDVFSELFSK